MKVLAKPIDVVACFTKEGVVRPAKFRVVNEDEGETVITVEKVLHTDREKLAGKQALVFRCHGAINGVERVYELKYEIMACKWVLFKM